MKKQINNFLTFRKSFLSLKTKFQDMECIFHLFTISFIASGISDEEFQQNPTEMMGKEIGKMKTDEKNEIQSSIILSNSKQDLYLNSEWEKI
ncbi:Uncharacterised protein [Candidatus Ornithobacterium hominis]|nr:Uncharacterised protein [Candidatus Ornithobacterium hominis]